jgi:hypothetical protein
MWIYNHPQIDPHARAVFDLAHNRSQSGTFSNQICPLDYSIAAILFEGIRETKPPVEMPGDKALKHPPDSSLDALRVASYPVFPNRGLGPA